MSESSIRQLISSAGIDIEKVDDIISQLTSLTFLGVEVGQGRFAYADEKKELQKNLILASRFATARGGEPRYEINTPFRTYLELEDPQEGLQLF